MSLVSTNRKLSIRRQWLPHKWLDNIQDFWDDFCADGKLEPEAEDSRVAGFIEQGSPLLVGSVCTTESIAARSHKDFLAEHAPRARFISPT